MRYLALDHFFTVLGNKQRAKILQLLNQEGPKSVSNITERLKAEQSAVSHNLKHLLSCHFVVVQQTGRERIYSINEDTVKPLLELIERHISKNCVKGCQHWGKQGEY